MAVSTTAVDPDPEVDGAEVDDVEADGWVVDGVVVVALLPDELLHAAPTMPTVASARPIPAPRIPRHGLPFVLCVEVRTMITLPDLGSDPPQTRRSQPRAITGERHDRIAGRTPPWPNHCIDAGLLTDQPHRRGQSVGLRRSSRLGHPSAASPALAELEGGGTSVEVALGEVATELLEKAGVLFRLHPLGHHLELEHVGHGDQCGDDGPGFGIGSQVAHKGAIDLDAVTGT